MIIRRMSKRLAALAAVAPSMSGGGSWASAAMVGGLLDEHDGEDHDERGRPRAKQPRRAVPDAVLLAHAVGLDVASRQAPDEPAQLLGLLRPGDERDADRHDGIGGEGGDGAPEAGGELGAEVDPAERVDLVRHECAEEAGDQPPEPPPT